MGAPSIVIAPSDGVVPVLDAAMAASARSYTTTFSDNTFVVDWKSDYNGRIDVSDLNAAFSEMTEVALKRQKAYRSQVISFLIYAGVWFTIYGVCIAVFAVTGNMGLGLYIFMAVGTCCMLVGTIVFLVRTSRSAREFRTAFSALCDGMTQRYANRGLYWSYDFHPGSKYHPGHLKVIISVVPMPGLPFSLHPHVTIMPGGFPPGYHNAPWVHQNAPPVYAIPGYQNAVPVYQQVGSLPEGAVAINFDDRSSLENTSLLSSQH